MLTEPRVVHMRTSQFRLTVAQPRQIDLTTIEQDNPDSIETKGIYALTGDELQYCIAPPFWSRPAKFATTQEDQYTLVVLKRVSSTLP
jgi:uncharacterized protein (TIGR03067 family)